MSATTYRYLQSTSLERQCYVITKEGGEWPNGPDKFKIIDALKLGTAEKPKGHYFKEVEKYLKPFDKGIVYQITNLGNDKGYANIHIIDKFGIRLSSRYEYGWKNTKLKAPAYEMKRYQRQQVWQREKSEGENRNLVYATSLTVTFTRKKRSN